MRQLSSLAEPGLSGLGLGFGVAKMGKSEKETELP